MATSSSFSFFATLSWALSLQWNMNIVHSFQTLPFPGPLVAEKHAHFYKKSSPLLFRKTVLYTKRLQAKDADNDDQDLFEYFDPLLSPHAYPNGISPDNPPLPEEELEKKPELRVPPPTGFGFALEQQEENNRNNNPGENYENPAFAEPSTDVFDPLISPHAYPNGVPDVVIGFEHEAESRTTSSSSKRKSSSTQYKRKRVGILLIDHGSRNKESNERLHELAKIYQQQYGSSSTVVKAAHMEIAQPSIPDALQDMIEETENVADDGCTLDEIVCHPFFLSPQGRHVSEDIPRIIEDAKKDLAIKIPITVTDPVGSQTSIMMQAVHALIQQSSSISSAR